MTGFSLPARWLVLMGVSATSAACVESSTEPPVTGSVILSVAGGGASYEAGSYGRLITLTSYVGITRPSEDDGPALCTEVIPENVTFGVVLPEGVSLGTGATNTGYDAGSRTATWAIEGLDCELKSSVAIEALIEIGIGIDDGALVTVPVSVTTTTPGDDPADNTASSTVPVGFLPLEVWLENFATPACDGSWSAHAPTSCESITPGSPSAVASWSTLADDWREGDVPLKIADLTRGSSFSLDIRSDASAASGLSCDISSCEGLTATTGASGNNARYSIRNPNPYPADLRLVEELQSSVSCDPLETSGPGQASANFTWHDATGPAIKCGYWYDGYYRPSTSWSSRLEYDSAEGSCSYERSDLVGPQACEVSPIVASIDLNSDSPRVQAQAWTEVVTGSGGTLESYKTGAAQAFARARWTVSVP